MLLARTCARRSRRDRPRAGLWTYRPRDRRDNQCRAVGTDGVWIARRFGTGRLGKRRKQQSAGLCTHQHGKQKREGENRSSGALSRPLRGPHHVVGLRRPRTIRRAHHAPPRLNVNDACCQAINAFASGARACERERFLRETKRRRVCARLSCRVKDDASVRQPQINPQGDRIAIRTALICTG